MSSFCYAQTIFIVEMSSWSHQTLFSLQFYQTLPNNVFNKTLK